MDLETLALLQIYSLVLPEDQSDANVIGFTCETQDECCSSQVSLELQ